MTTKTDIEEIALAFDIEPKIITKHLKRFGKNSALQNREEEIVFLKLLANAARDKAREDLHWSSLDDRTI